jgi:transmembrane sensor
MGAIDNRIKDLIIGYLREELQPWEMQELENWIQSSEENRSLFTSLTDPDLLAAEMREFHHDKQAVWDKITRLTNGFSPYPEKVYPSPVLPIETDSLLIPSHRSGRRNWLYAAACIPVFILAGLYFWHKSSSNTTVADTVKNISTDVLPGGNKAILKLADGSTILLDSAGNGRLAQQGTTDIIKMATGELAYRTSVPHTSATISEDQLSKHQQSKGDQQSDANQPSNGGSKSMTESLAYNTLSTPRAGQFRIVLPDGTKVWLNNASSLRYPTAFTGSERSVELSGEAYFEVSPLITKSGHERVPFKVFVIPASGGKGIQVDVLGTHFNIMAYPDEEAIRTTLVEGKVRVTRAGQQAVLNPGEQVLITGDRNWVLSKGVDTDEIIDWKNGFFHFNHSNLNDVMRQLARWYDVDVEYQGAIPAQLYQGSIKRDLTLTQVLENLGGRDIHFKIEGRKVVITP